MLGLTGAALAAKIIVRDVSSTADDVVLFMHLMMVVAASLTVQVLVLVLLNVQCRSMGWKKWIIFIYMYILKRHQFPPASLNLCFCMNNCN
mmetsp:Transcript_10384/g.15632  ORF Transcript_10384/g.15632 Transcript_10384/m.15632 type:complete len:91 (+) Transcript_10384:440-712(+)